MTVWENRGAASTEATAGSVPVHIDFDAIANQFELAVADGRDFLFEYEVYELLRRSGAETPPGCKLLIKGSRPSDEELMAMAGDNVVLKVVSPTVIHKTEAGGVKIVEKRPEKIRSAWRRMLYEVPENYAIYLQRHPGQEPAAYRGLSAEALIAAIASDIRGVLMVQFMAPDSEAFGNELIVGIRRTREFGMVISAGLGGTDTELYARRFRKGQAVVAASTQLTDGPGFFELFRQSISYKKLAGLTRGQRRIVTDEQLVECFSSFIAMANFFSPHRPGASFVIDELEVNPFAFTDFLMVPLDGLCRFSRPVPHRAPRPVKKIHRLLHPKTIGIVGVSASRMNFGRIILNNIIKEGFDPKQLVVIRPGVDAIDSVKCLPDLSALSFPLDLLVVAVDAAAVPGLVDQILLSDAAASVMLIAGGIGEKRGSEDLAEKLFRAIDDAHRKPEGGPIFLGSNCLGVVSHPGGYDTLFIPDEKLPKPRTVRPQNAAIISQSGAFMITRLSKCPQLDPHYLISIGNQTDLTLGDFLAYFCDASEIDTLAVYAEGFRDLDGLATAQAVRQAVGGGKEVIVYKAGRTPEGKSATSGHTASLAGDYMVCESCLRQAGAMVAQTFTQFEALCLLSERLHQKQVRGNRLAVVSGAGFEAVGMADSICTDDYQMQLAQLSPGTVNRIQSVLSAFRLEALVDVKNPLDITPGANDEVHAQIVEILAADDNVDAVVIGLDPLSPATYTLPGSEMKYSLDAEKSIARLMPVLAAKTAIPIVGVVDGGKIYDPLVEALEAGGLAVFRSSDVAVAALALYIEGRLNAERIRSRQR
jgi:acyl-CoA synthetase (NDP forming)